MVLPLPRSLAAQPPRIDPPRLLQHPLQALRQAKPHPAVAHLYSDAEFEKKRAYNLAKLRFSSVHSLWDSALTAAMLLAGFLPATWQLAGALLARWGGGRAWLQGEAAQSVAWVLIQVGC